MFLREREREIVRVRGGSNGRMGLWEGERIKGKCGESPYETERRNRHGSGTAKTRLGQGTRTGF